MNPLCKSFLQLPQMCIMKNRFPQLFTVILDQFTWDQDTPFV